MFDIAALLLLFGYCTHHYATNTGFWNWVISYSTHLCFVRSLLHSPGSTLAVVLADIFCQLARVPVCIYFVYFGSVGWVAGRAFGLLKNSVMRYWHGYLSGARYKWLAYGPANATAIPSSLALVEPRMFYPSGIWMVWYQHFINMLSWKSPWMSCCCCCCCFCLLHNNFDICCRFT